MLSRRWIVIHDLENSDLDLVFIGESGIIVVVPSLPDQAWTSMTPSYTTHPTRLGNLS